MVALKMTCDFQELIAYSQFAVSLLIASTHAEEERQTSHWMLPKLLLYNFIFLDISENAFSGFPSDFFRYLI